MPHAERRRLLESLADIAASLGYTNHRGPKAGRGSVNRLLVAIARGEIVLRKTP